MKRLLFLACLAAPGCAGLTDTLKDPSTVQLLDQIAQQGAEKAALKTAAQFQITDESAVKRLVDEAKAASSGAVNAAVARLDAQDKASKAQWRADTMAAISAALKGVGGAMGGTGNPILIALGALMGVGGLLTSKKKETA